MVRSVEIDFREHYTLCIDKDDKNAYNKMTKYYIKGDREVCLSCAVVAVMKCIAQMRNLGRLGSVKNVDNGTICSDIPFLIRRAKWFRNM